MVYWTYGLFLFLNFIFALRKTHSKLLSIITFAFILIMFTGYYNIGNMSLDFYGYMSNYNDIGVGTAPTYNMEIGYVLLMKIGNLIGLNFFIFKIIITIICSLLIIKTISQYTKNYNAICFLYMLYPIIADTERFRNFIALSILIYAIRFLMRNTNKDKLKYVIFILLASTLHSSMIIYLLFLLVNIANKNRLVKYIAVSTIILCFIAFINHNIMPGLDYISSIFPSEKLLNQLSNVTNYGYLIPFSLHAINLILIYISKRNISNFTLSSYSRNETVTKESFSYINFIFWVNVLSITFFPLYMHSLIFSRLTTDLSLLNFIAYAITIDSFRKGSSIRFGFIVSASIILIVWLYSDFFISMTPDMVFKPFFEQNVFFDWRLLSFYYKE